LDDERGDIPTKKKQKKQKNKKNKKGCGQGGLLWWLPYGVYGMINVGEWGVYTEADSSLCKYYYYYYCWARGAWDCLHRMRGV
jgi:hypothetical protein